MNPSLRAKRGNLVFVRILFLLCHPAKPAHESVIASEARQSGVRPYPFHPLSS
jgi:hypothetical protein